MTKDEQVQCFIREVSKDMRNKILSTTKDPSLVEIHATMQNEEYSQSLDLKVGSGNRVNHVGRPQGREGPRLHGRGGWVGPRHTWVG